MRRPIAILLLALAGGRVPLAAQQPTLLPAGSFRGTLLGAAVYDAQVALAVGYEGVILRTHDGGANWWRIPSGTTANLDGVTFVGVTAFAVGANGTLLRSQDGGVNWHALASGVTSRLKSVHFGDAQRGVIVGDNGVVLRTQDGGSSWTWSATGVTSGLIDVRMAGPAAVAVGADGVVLRSEDGGGTWQRVGVPTTEWLTGVTVAGTRTAAVVGLSNAALYTADIGAAAWAAGAMPSSVGMSDVAQVEGATLIAVGSSGTMLRSADFGQSWRLTHQGNGFAFEDVAFADPRTGWAVGNNGVIMRTTDGGATWVHQMSVPGASAAASAGLVPTTIASPLYLQVLGLSVPAPLGTVRWSASVATASNGNRMDELQATGMAGELYMATVVRVEGRECANVLAQLIQSGGQMRTAPAYTPTGWFQVAVEQSGNNAFTCLPLRQGSLMAGFAMTSIAQMDPRVVRPLLTALGDAALARWGRP